MVFIRLGILSKNYWSLLNHPLMANIWEKYISFLAENLNSGLSYLITTVINISNCPSSPLFLVISGAYLRIYRFVLVTEDNGRNIYGSAGFEALKRQQSTCFCLTMGGTLSHFFQSGHALLSSSHNRYAYF